MHGWNGDSDGIVKSCFWAFARIDVWAAFSLDQTTLIPTSSWVQNDSVEQVAAAGDLDDYCNLTTLMFARIVNILNESRSDSDSHARSTAFGFKVRKSWAELQLWRRCRLQEATPILDSEASRSNPFPTIVYTQSSSSKSWTYCAGFAGEVWLTAAVCGNTFYHAACILLLQTGIVTLTSSLDPPEVVSPFIVPHVSVLLECLTCRCSSKAYGMRWNWAESPKAIPLSKSRRRYINERRG